MYQCTYHVYIGIGRYRHMMQYAVHIWSRFRPWYGPAHSGAPHHEGQDPLQPITVFFHDLSKKRRRHQQRHQHQQQPISIINDFNSFIIYQTIQISSNNTGGSCVFRSS